MSSVTVEINGRETVSQAALQASGSVKKMSDDSKSFLKDIQVTAGDLVGAIQGIASTVGEFFTEYAAQQKSILTFNAAISQSAQLTDGSSDRLKEYAGAMALKTGADDDAILSMVAFLATAGRTEEQIRKVISAAADMSVVTGKDLRGSVEDINKTFSGSEGRMGQVVLGLQNLTDEELKAGKGVDVIAAQYGGLADSMGESASVALANFKNTFDDTKAALGEAFMPAVMPILEALVNFLNDPVIPTIQGFAPIVQEVFANVEKFIQEMKPAVEPILKWFGEIWTNTIGPNIKSIGTILKETLNIVSGIINGDWKRVWGGLKTAINEVVEIIKRALQPVVDFIDKIVAGIDKAVQFLKGAVKSKGGPVPDSFFDLPMQGYASGTTGAKKGWALVGEQGPEVVYFNGGEEVIPNHQLNGYAAGTLRDDTLGTGGGGSSLSTILDVVGNTLTRLMDGFMGLITPLSSMQAILNPLQTIFSAMMDVLGPLINTILQPIVGILKIIGMTIGQMLAPILSALAPVIKLIGDAFVWLYNNAIRPFANFIISIGNFLFNAIASAYNWINNIWGGSDIKLKESDDGYLKEITSTDLNAVGATGSTGSTSGAAATYDKPRDIMINVQVTTAALVGNDGISQFALIIGRELRSAGVLGMA